MLLKSYRSWVNLVFTKSSLDNIHLYDIFWYYLNNGRYQKNNIEKWKKYISNCLE